MESYFDKIRMKSNFDKIKMERFFDKNGSSFSLVQMVVTIAML